MKKFTQAGKKALSVFLAALMVMTAWVFVAPEKAEALSAGSYYVEIVYKITNEGSSLPNKYVGENSWSNNDWNKDTNNRGGISLHFKRNNGTGTAGEVYWNVGQSSKDGGQVGSTKDATVEKATGYIDDKTDPDYYARATIPGFPTNIFAYLDYNSSFTKASFKITELKIASKKGGTFTTLWKGGMEVSSHKNVDRIRLNSNGTFTDKYGGPVTSTESINWNFPKANQIVWDTDTTNWSSNNLRDCTISTGSTDVTRLAKFHVVDQYGVNMSTAALSSLDTPVGASVTSTNFESLGKTTPLGTSNTKNLYYTATDADDAYSVKVTAKSALKSLETGLNERKVTITAKAGTSKSSAKSFWIRDPKYKITFEPNCHDGTISPIYYNVYYGESLKSQKALDNNAATYPVGGTRTGYTWLGMFDAATGGNPMNIEEAVTAAKTYYAQWSRNQYTVVFLNRKGEYVDVQYIYHGEDADSHSPAAKLPKMEYDSVKHYTLNESAPWSPAVNNVTGNIITKAQYTAGEHDFDNGVAVAATCHSGAGTKYTCEVCGYSYIKDESSDRTPHTFGDAITVTKEPTCTATGEGYKTCTVCGAHGNTETISATGHSYKVEKTPASCTKTGSIKYTCTKCGHVETDTLPKTAHDMKAQTKVAATCTSAAYTAYKCANCSFTYNVYDNTQPAVGHSWGAWTVTKKATNTTDGEMKRTCSKDSSHVEIVAIPKGNHTFSTTPTSETAATCHSTGTQVFKCTAHTGANACGVQITVTTAKLAHNFKTTKTDATCTKDGSVVTKCQNSGCTETITTTVPALGHNYGAGTVKKEATCTEPGTIEHTCTRSGCGAKMMDTIPAKGHTTVEVVTDCTSGGTIKCSVCNNEIGNIPKKAHDYTGEEKTILAAGCTTQGVKTIKCKHCDAVKTELIPAKGTHSWSNWTTLNPETCTTDRVEQRVCSVCQQLETQTVKNTKGHKWGELTVDVETTCTTAGVQSKHCSRCGARTEVTVINAPGHTWNNGEVTKEATCTTDGVKTFTCTTCNEKRTETVPALGHNFVAGTPVPATCRSSGYIPYTCSRNCGVAGYNVINGDSSIVHDWNITTSTANGKTTVSGVCTICGATFSKTVDSAHNFKNITTNNPATCLEKGLLVIACADTGCSEALSVELPVNPNAHRAIKTTVTNPTCTENGKVTTVCEACNATVYAEQTIPAKGHSYTTHTEYDASTCKTKGHVTFKCANCPDTHTVELDINPNAHNFVKGTHHDATCTTPAYDEYVCEYGCGETYNKYDGGEVNAHVWKFTTSKTGTTLTVTCKCENCDASHTQTIDVAKGHNYVNAAVTKQPTCTEEGAVTIACDKKHDANCTSVVTATLPVNPNAHSGLKTTVTPATCETNGTATTVCESCGNTVGDSATIAALGHNYVDGEGTVITAATCENDGKKTVKCTRCTNTMETVIPKTGHSWDGGTSHAADCTHGAYTTYKCSNCNKTYDAVADGAKALGHDWNDWVIVNPTNDTDGSVTRTCKRCNEPEKVKIPAQGHKFDASTYTETKATCTVKGSRTYTCTAHTGENACGVSVTVDTDFAPHSYNDGVRTEATCTERAYTTYTCTGCGRVRVVFDDSDAGKPTGHNYDYGESTAACEAEGTVEVTCSKCGDVQTNVPVPALGHDFSKVQTVVDATCHSVGYMVYKCSRCDKTKTEYKNELVAHVWSKWTVTKEPTETMNGEQERHCTNEGCTETETAPIPATIHNWIEQPELSTAATCTKAATKTYYCSGCSVCTDKEHIENNAHYVESVGVPLQHSVKVDYNAPTCTENGSYRAYCDRCNEVEFVNETIPPTGHSFNTRTDYQAPTCSVEGSVTFKCRCGEMQTKSLDVISTAHDWGLKETINATCTKAGYKLYVCRHNNEHTYKEFLSDPVKHTEGSWVTKKEATCCSDGYKVLECKDCSAVLKTESIPATNGHNFVEVKSDNAEPTCTEGSYSYKKCSACGKLDNESFAVKNALGHDFSVFVEKQDATATENGYVIYRCSRCDATLKSFIPASGHNYTSEVTKEPTCTETGVRTYTCTAEGHDDSYTEEIPALGHKAGKAAVTEATCLAQGSVVVKCTRCGDTLQTEPLPTLAHTFNEAHKTVIPATCQTNGSITYTCATDGCTETLVTVIDKLPHDYKFKRSVAPTCLDSGYDIYECVNFGECKASYNVVTKPANGHSFFEDTARTVQPTCSTVGHKYFKCSVCGTEGYDYEVPATGRHNYTETVVVSATCESAGYTYKKCTCGAVEKSSIKALDALGHDYSVDEGNGVFKCSRCDSRITVEKTITEEDGTVHALKGTVTKQSTCKEQGTIEYVCQIHENCSKNHTEALPLAAHSANADSIVKTEPKCNADGRLTDGSIVVKCSVCGEQIGDTVVLPAAHKYTVVKVERATCGSKGKVTERCSVCGHEKVTELEMDASAHEFNSLPSIKVAPTCTTDGYEVYYCKHCDAQKFVKTGVMLDHGKTKTQTKNPTCTAEGYVRTTCEYCGKVIKKTVLQKLPHTEKTVTIAATCTEKGSTTVVCSVCNTILKETEYTPALGHDWGEWKVTVPGTCAVEGKKTRECSRCHEKETISTGIGEHVYSEKGVVTPATCTADGYTTYTCTVCNKYSVIRDYTPKLGHKYSADYKIIVEPTCHSTGTKAHYCVRCGAFEPDYLHNYVELPKLAHTYGEWVVTTEPTCDTNGVKTRTCTGCTDKDEGHTQTELIGKKGHNYGEWEITKKSTCVEEGSQRRYCDRCKTWEVQATPKGGHNRVADYAVEATCTAPGKTAGSHCSICGYVFVAQQEVPMKEHMDLNGDGRCEGCGKTMYSPNGETDSCLCHGTGFRAFIYKIVLIIWKIFKINKNCVCGAKHY